MSIHPSLSSSSSDSFKQRSVLKRNERIKELVKKGNFSEANSAFGLPKVKTLKIRVKKIKAAAKETGEEKKEEKPANSSAANKPNNKK